MHGGTTEAGLFERNMYLAEDRILCFEIVTKKREAWTLKYVKSAKASTDVPTTVAEFISQRRRWLNGSLFASIHATVFWFRIWTSGQGIFRMLALQIELIYNAVQLLFTWTSLANFYLAFFFVRATFVHRSTGFPSITVSAARRIRHIRHLQRCFQFSVQRCRANCLRSFPQALHRRSVRRPCLFPREPTTRVKMGVLNFDDSVWTLQHHYPMVRRLYCLSGGATHARWVEGFPRVCSLALHALVYPTDKSFED